MNSIQSINLFEIPTFDEICEIERNRWGTRVRAKLETVWKQICEFIKKTWDVVRSWFPRNPYYLTNKQIKLIEKEKRKSIRLERKVSLPSTKKPLHKMPEVRIEMSADPVCPKEKPLQDLCEFLSQFSAHLSKVIQDEVVVPALPDLKLQLIDSLSQAKEWGKPLYNLTSAISKLGFFKDPLFIMAAPVLFCILQRYSQEKNIPQEDLENITDRIIKELIDQKQILEQQGDLLKSYIQQIFHLLRSSENWEVITHKPTVLYKLLVDGLHFISVFSEKLKDGKFDAKIKVITELVESNFEEDVQKTIDLNVQPITEFLSFRLSELISHAPFQEIFNAILQQTVAQLEAFQAADGKRKKHQDLIRNAEHDVIRKGDARVWGDAKAILKIVHKAGGQEKFLENKFRHKYRKQPVCQTSTAQLMQKINPKEHKKIIEEMSEDILERLFPYFLPPEVVKLPDGSKVTISGVARILEKLTYSENIQKIMDTMNEMIGEALNSKDFNDIENFKTYLPIIRTFLIVEVFHEKLTSFIKLKIKEIFNTLSSKEFLDSKLSQVVFPSLINTLLLSWIATTASRKVADIAPLFHLIIESEDQTESMQALKAKLYEMMCKAKQDFKIEEEVGEKQFNLLVHPFIITIIDHLITKLKKGNPSRSIKVREITEELNSYFKTPEDIPVNPIFQKLIQKAFFEIGGYSGVGVQTSFKWFSDSINQLASIAFFDVSKSYHLSVSNLVATLSATFGSEMSVKQAVFEEEPLDDPEKINNKLDKLLRNIGAIIHDSMYRTLESKTGGFLLKRGALGTDKTAEAIKKLYHELFKDPLLNWNLLSVAVDLLEKGLSRSVENLKASRVIAQKVEVLRNTS